MPKITALYAFVVEDTGPDDEGILAASVGDDIFLPLVGADMERVNSLKPTAAKLAGALGKPVKIVLFSERTEVEVLNP